MQKGNHVHKPHASSIPQRSSRRNVKNSKKVPIQGIIVVLLSIVLYLMVLGAAVFLAKFIMG